MKAFLSLFSRLVVCNALFIGLMGVLNILFDQNWGIRSGTSFLALPKSFGELALLVTAIFLLAALLEGLARSGDVFRAIKRKPAAAFGVLAMLTALLVIGGNYGLTMLMGGPLMRAVEMGNTQKVTELVQQNSYESAALNEPLYFALKQSDYEMAAALVKAGADVNHIGDGEFESPLLVSSVFHFEEEAIAFLLEQGANPDLQDNLGRTGMMVAVIYRPAEAMSILPLLHEAGGNINIKNNDGKTVIELADQSTDPSVIDYLNKIATVEEPTATSTVANPS